MTAGTIVASKQPSGSTSLPTKLLNMFACPGEVFDEVVCGPVAPANWLAPVLLVGLSSLLALSGNSMYPQTSAVLGQIRDAGGASEAQVALRSGDWRALFCLAACLTALAGTCWSAFVLWALGRLVLKSRFSYLKALEIAGLTGIIVALGGLVTALLIAATGDSAARPALALLVGGLNAGGRARAC